MTLPGTVGNRIGNIIIVMRSLLARHTSRAQVRGTVVLMDTQLIKERRLARALI